MTIKFLDTLGVLFKDELKEIPQKNYKKIIATVSAIIAVVIMIDFFIKVNNNNQRNSYFAKTLLMPKKIVKFFKNYFKKFTQKNEIQNTFVTPEACTPKIYEKIGTDTDTKTYTKQLFISKYEDTKKEFTLNDCMPVLKEDKLPTEIKCLEKHICHEKDTKQTEIKTSTNNLHIKKSTEKTEPEEDVSGDTDLHRACKNGDFETVERLVKNNFNIEAKNNYDLTPLHMACITGQLKIVKFLLKNKAHIEEKDDRKHTPLHTSLFYKQKKVALYLIEMGANIHVKNNLGNTPLHIACKTKKTKIIKILVEKGANVNEQNNKGEIPTPKDSYHPLKTKHLKFLSDHGSNFEKLCKTASDHNNEFYIAHRNIDDILSGDFYKSINYKIRNNPKKLKKRIIELIYDEKTPSYDKQTALQKLFKNIKNPTKKMELINQIPFNNRFFEDQEFKDIFVFAKKDLRDKFDRSFFLASLIFEKDKNIPFNLLMDMYTSQSYPVPKTLTEKQLKKETKKILSYAQSNNKRLLSTLKNTYFILNDLKTKNLANVMGNERLEPKIAINIMRLIGFDGIKNDKVYFT